MSGPDASGDEGYRSPDDAASARLQALLGAILDTVARVEVSREIHGRDVAEILGSTDVYADELLTKLGVVCERWATEDISAAEFGIYLGLRIGDRLGYAKGMNTVLGPTDQGGAP